MGSPARKPATYEDLLKLPDDKIGEIVDGELSASPRPAGRHASCAFTLSTEIGPPFQAKRGGPGGWLFMFEPELHLADDTLVPDLAGWRRERMPAVPDVAAVALARHGVGHAWLINPSTRTLEVYRRDGGSWVLAGTHADDAIVRAEPFGAIELDLLRLWGEERPTQAG